MESYQIFTVKDGRVYEGAGVEDFTLANGDTIPALLVGEKGRGRQLGVLPVKGAEKKRELPPHFGEVGGKYQTLRFAEVAESRTGRPILIAAKAATTEDFAIVVFSTSIGFRGSNEHTAADGGELAGKILARGVIAQGAAGRVAAGEQLIVLLPRGEEVVVNRYGRLYGEPPTFHYMFDGKSLLVALPDEREFVFKEGEL